MFLKMLNYKVAVTVYPLWNKQKQVISMYFSKTKAKLVSPLHKSSISCIKDRKPLNTRPEVQKLGSLLFQDTSHKKEESTKYENES